MRWIVHIGLYKAASSSLQKAFAETPGILYLGKYAQSAYLDTASQIMVREYLSTLSPYGFDPGRVADWKRATEQRALGDEAADILISDEVFSATERGAGTGAAITQLAILQQAFGPDLHIILVIRNQFDWIRSSYIQQLRKGITCGYQQYVAWHAVHFDMSRFQWTWYARTVRFLASQGIAATVLPFEHLIDSGSPWGKLGERLGIALPPLPRENHSPPDRSTIAWLAFNRRTAARRPLFREARFDGHYRKTVYPRLQELGCDMTQFDDWYAMLGGVRRECEALELPPATAEDDAFMTLPPELIAFLTQRFRQQNSGLGPLLGIPDLAERGYCMAPPGRDGEEAV